MSSEGYQVIARRWRPKQFSELVGQDYIVQTLMNAIKLNRIAHAYLFVGPRGTGKTSIARLLAKSLNCTGGPSIVLPEDCPICKAISESACMDVIEIDGASNNSVDQIRELRDACHYAPSQARFKIYIIDEVHMLTNAAFNALLKTLEEPPAHVKFIFATTESHKVLPTIVSRCQRFELRPIPDTVIAEKLKMIAQCEGLNIENAAFSSIARLASGGMRDAQSLLDQLISFCGNTITEEDVINVYGLASSDELKALVSAMVRGNYLEIIEICKKFDAQGRDLYRVLKDLQHRFHEVLLDSIKNEGVSIVLEVSKTTESLMRMLNVLQEGEKSLRMGLSEKINFEIILLKAVDEGRSRAIDSLIKEISLLKDQCAENPKKNPDAELTVKKDFLSERPIVNEARPATDSLEIKNTENLTTVIDEAKKKLTQSTLDILENQFRAEFRALEPLKIEEWIT